MDYDTITDVADVDKRLVRMSIELDRTEYDDEELYQQVLAQLYPEEVAKLAERAAELGSVRGMHLYGRTLELQPTRSQSLAFNQLTGEDPMGLVTYLRDVLQLEVTQEEIDEGSSLYEELSSEMKAQGIEKQPCDCIFP